MRIPSKFQLTHLGWDDFSDQEDSTEINYDNLLPQTVVTQVGEHLLSLVNEIETFASSDAIYDLAPLYGTASDLNSIKKCWKSLFTSTDVMEVFVVFIKCMCICAKYIFPIVTE